MMYLMLILAAVLITIAAYYPIKLIKFYCMESKEQSVKNQIISDLRAGRVSSQLVRIILGDGGFRLVRRELEHIFEWMLLNTDAWKVHTYADEKVVVVFANSPFHPEEWDNYEDYKHAIRQMFDGSGTYDFLTSRTTEVESYRIMKNIATEEAETLLEEYSNE